MPCCARDRSVGREPEASHVTKIGSEDSRGAGRPIRPRHVTLNLSLVLCEDEVITVAPPSAARSVGRGQQALEEQELGEERDGLERGQGQEGE